MSNSLWTVYDNATDSVMASGSYNEVIDALGMTATEFDDLCAQYMKGERSFVIGGKRTSINIMVDGFNLSRGYNGTATTR